MKESNVRRTIAAAICIFVLTVAIARTISFYWPRFHLDLYPGVRIHHYVYGIFLLTVAGYLALLFKGPRATAWIACMYGLGVGLTFDEFGFWMNLNARGVRWNTGGLTLIGTLFFVSIAAPAIYSKVRKEIYGLTETRAKARDYEVSNHLYRKHVVAGFSFQLPTSLAASKPSTISVRRDRPRQMTVFPGGGSVARAR